LFIEEIIANFTLNIVGALKKS